MTESQTIKRVLIANRGEIAARVIYTLRKLNITSIAIFSKFDRQSPYISLADEAIALEGNNSQETYLNISQIIKIAKQHHIDAIHPGYGFLSENPYFASECFNEGITFIGPTASAIAAMGSKAEAKKLMEAAHVPVVPGYHGTDQSLEKLELEATKIGFPLLIKAAAGGGGKGMRRVNKAADLQESIHSAQSEAQKFFSDNRLIIEKYITAPRHVEVQILSDRHGNHLHVFERDCSIQRRHQKIIEEAPAIIVPDNIKQSMYKAATQAAAAIDYEGAGTIEFLYDTHSQQFYFMEMNTRLQVEHPVSESISGLDLVEWQIRIAQGEALPLEIAKIEPNGHAIEARIYAEDPFQQFLPASGHIHHIQWPTPTSSLHLYTSTVSNSEISVFFDPMIAKVIAWGESRQQAINRLYLALCDLNISGISTNVHYLKTILREKDFSSNTFDTSYVDIHPELQQPPNREPTFISALAAVVTETYIIKQSSTNIWNSLAAWQLNTLPEIHMSFHCEDADDISIKGEQLKDDIWHFNITSEDEADVQIDCEVLTCFENEAPPSFPLKDSSFFISQENIKGFSYTLHLLIDQVREEFQLYINEKEFWVYQKSGEFHFTRYDYQPKECKDTQDLLTAPMNGTLIDVRVQNNDHVSQNQILLVIEAMKMEHPIKASAPGIVKNILYQVGDQVSAGVELITIEPEEA